jgi:hypothetical protein
MTGIVAATATVTSRRTAGHDAEPDLRARHDRAGCVVFVRRTLLERADVTLRMRRSRG